MFGNLFRKANADTYVLGFMVSCGVSYGIFVGTRKLIYDPDLQIRNKTRWAK